MKNKLFKLLLFTICIMPIMVKAIDISSIKKEWDYKRTLPSGHYYGYDFGYSNREIISTDDSFIFINEDNILKMNKSTGKKTEIQFEHYYYLNIIDDKIHVEQEYQDDTGKYILQKQVIDYDLNILEDYKYKSNVRFEWNRIKNDYIIFTEEKSEVSSGYNYVLNLSKLNNKLEVKASSEEEINLYNNVNFWLTSKDNKPAIKDSYENYYYINDNLSLTPKNQHSDKSYIIRDGGYLVKKDKNHQEIEKSNFNNSEVLDIEFYENNYYVLTKKSYGNNKYSNVFYTIDENINILKTKETEIITTSNSSGLYMYFYLDEEYLKVVKNEDYSYKHYIVDSNLNITEIPDTNSSSNNNYYVYEYSSSVTKEEHKKIREMIEKECEEDEYLRLYIIKNQEGNFYVAVEHFYEYESNKKEFREVRMYNKEYKEVFKKNIATSDGSDFYNDCGDKDPVFFIELIDNYLLVANSTLDDTELYFMDKTGEIIKDLSSDVVDKELVPYKIIPEEKGMLIIYSLERLGCPAGIEQSDSIRDNFSNNKTKSLKIAPPSRYAYQLIYYSYNYVVNSKTDGNGSVNSEKVQAKSGEEIKFTVTPNEGYVLEKVKVTDSKGNVVTFKDYTFTMPSSDVTIEATFVKEVQNPVTSANSRIIFIALLAIFVFILSSYKMKKILK